MRLIRTSDNPITNLMNWIIAVFFVYVVLIVGGVTLLETAFGDLTLYQFWDKHTIVHLMVGMSAASFLSLAGGSFLWAISEMFDWDI